MTNGPVQNRTLRKMLFHFSFLHKILRKTSINFLEEACRLLLIMHKWKFPQNSCCACRRFWSVLDTVLKLATFTENSFCDICREIFSVKYLCLMVNISLLKCNIHSCWIYYFNIERQSMVGLCYCILMCTVKKL